MRLPNWSVAIVGLAALPGVASAQIGYFPNPGLGAYSGLAGFRGYNYGNPYSGLGLAYGYQGYAVPNVYSGYATGAYGAPGFGGATFGGWTSFGPGYGVPTLGGLGTGYGGVYRRSTYGAFPGWNGSYGYGYVGPAGGYGVGLSGSSPAPVVVQPVVVQPVPAPSTPAAAQNAAPAASAEGQNTTQVKPVPAPSGARVYRPLPARPQNRIQNAAR